MGVKMQLGANRLSETMPTGLLLSATNRTNEEAAVADAGFTQVKVKGAQLHLCLFLVKRV